MTNLTLSVTGSGGVVTSTVPLRFATTLGSIAATQAGAPVVASLIIPPRTSVQATVTVTAGSVTATKMVAVTCATAPAPAVVAPPVATPPPVVAPPVIAAPRVVTAPRAGDAGCLPNGC